MLFTSFICSLFLVAKVTAAPQSSAPSLSKRCTNSADDRSCWGDYDISTNYYEEAPDTGVTREYWFNIVNTTAAPDGVERVVLSVNGSIPGPTIIADWGDTVAWDGIFGGILINGPATANYDEDLGNLFLNDWSHLTADVEVLAALASGPPTLDTGLINGTNVYNETGSRYETTFEAGKRYLLRLVNAAADSHFHFSIDNHTLEVIASDFVPIEPYTTDVVSIAMGQRYDVIVTANATADNYWMRALIQTACSDNANPDNVRGIIRYDSTSTDDPTSTAWDDATTDGTCYDEDISQLVPYVPITASSTADYEDDFSVKIVVGDNGVLWEMGPSSFVNQWDYPSLLQVEEGNDTWADSQQVYAFPDADTWVYWVIQTTNNQPHPMHLHGHDFWILGQGLGTYDADTANLTYTNPPRRDVVQLPGAGYVVIAFYTDNPGVWLMHCHIAWHTSEGLAVQVLERESEIGALIDADVMNSTCAAWDDYTAEDDIIQDDSGI
ncbi:hypothetical protein KJ359_010868 [Pestalotiopsis sp. 9143b]|nr:hypothetical protein KJ359_010868 [Pestalotiopsis sp. 9143b]